MSGRDRSDSSVNFGEYEHRPASGYYGPESSSGGASSPAAERDTTDHRDGIRNEGREGNRTDGTGGDASVARESVTRDVRSVELDADSLRVETRRDADADSVARAIVRGYGAVTAALGGAVLVVGLLAGGVYTTFGDTVSLVQAEYLVSTLPVVAVTFAFVGAVYATLRAPTEDAARGGAMGAGVGTFALVVVVGGLAAFTTGEYSLKVGSLLVNAALLALVTGGTAYLLASRLPSDALPFVVSTGDDTAADAGSD